MAKALAVNPRHAGAFAVRAGSRSATWTSTAPTKAIAEGLKGDPNDLELLEPQGRRALPRRRQAGLRGREEARSSPATRSTRTSSPSSASTPSGSTATTTSSLMMQEAVKVDPNDAKAWAQLGLNLDAQRRRGQRRARPSTRRGRRTSSTSASTTRSTSTTSTSTPATIRSPTAPSRSATRSRKSRSSSATCPRMLDEAWASMKARYGFVPQNPVQVELYGDTAPAAWTRGSSSRCAPAGCRTSASRACASVTTLAAMSPGAEPFNWGNVVWHELGHVFAIQLSKNHVPRWFTEGLERVRDHRAPPRVAARARSRALPGAHEGHAPGAIDMNRAFTHANSAADVTVAYYAASQMLVYTVTEFGMPKVVEALKLWGQGLRTPDVLQRAFGLSAADYDKTFRAWALARLGRYKGQFIPDQTLPQGRRRVRGRGQEGAQRRQRAPRARALVLRRGKEGRREEGARAGPEARSQEPARALHGLPGRQGAEGSGRRRAAPRGHPEGRRRLHRAAPPRGARQGQEGQGRPPGAPRGRRTASIRRSPRR